MQISDHEANWLTTNGTAMLSTLGISPKQTALDFGCGVGRYSIPLSQAVGPKGSVTAIERNPDDIQVLKDRISQFPTEAPIKISTSDDFHLTIINDATIDVALAFDVLQYVHDWPAFFKATKRILRPSGILHVYPAAIPHPNAVETELMDHTLIDAGFSVCGKSSFTMMHNKHMVEDTIHTYRAQNDQESN